MRSERGVAWIAHLNGVQGVAGSNPAAPIFYFLDFWDSGFELKNMSWLVH